MKNLISISMMTILMWLTLDREALAVWVPEESMEQSVNVSREDCRKSSEIHPLIERIENDERRLAAIIEELKQDEKKISELADSLKKKEQDAAGAKERK